MKEFAAVFLVLLGLIGAFVVGRKFPENSIEKTAEQIVSSNPGEELQKCLDTQESIKKKLTDLSEEKLLEFGKNEASSVEREKIYQSYLSETYGILNQELGTEIRSSNPEQGTKIPNSAVETSTDKVESPNPSAIQTTTIAAENSTDKDQRVKANSEAKPDTDKIIQAETKALDAKAKRKLLIKRVIKDWNAADALATLEDLALDHYPKAEISGKMLSRIDIKPLLFRFEGAVLEIGKKQNFGKDKLSFEIRSGVKQNDYRFLIQIKGSKNQRISGSGSLSNWKNWDEQIWIPFGKDYLAVIYNPSLETIFGTLYSHDGSTLKARAHFQLVKR